MQFTSRKLAAAFTIAIFLISTFATIAPAQATFTLGNLSGASPYEINNFDPHVAGPIGYVWPGSGQCAYDGYPNQANDNCSPGYQSPYPSGNPPGAPSNSWYQLGGDTYAPFGAVLTNSTGDLIFGLNATCLPAQWNTGCAASNFKHEIQTPLSNVQVPSAKGLGWDTWFILIPPEFTVPGSSQLGTSQIVSTLSNSYNRYVVAKLSPNDRYAPNWTLVAITADLVIDELGPPGVLSNIYYAHQSIQFTNAGEWYYVRINGVRAPSVAGRYFFKMALSSTNFPPNAPAFPGLTFYGNSIFGAGPTLAGPNVGLVENPFVWVPPQNWPVLLVKGETDPAIMTGTLRYAGYNSTLYQQPIAEAGMVWAHMTMRIDPYTGQNRPDLPTIDGQAYVNATANGHYELEGLAPGVYDVYAEAAGYPQTLCTSGVIVLKGQSLHFDCYLQPGPVIHGNVFTKHQFGDEPWPGNSTTGQYMKIELYTKPTLSNLVDSSAGPPVSWSPFPCVAGGQEDYQVAGAAGLCGDPRDASAIAFPWHEYSTVQGQAYGDPSTLFTGQQNGYSRDVAISGGCTVVLVALGFCSFPAGSAGSTLGVNALLASDPEGVGPPQHWFVSGGTTTPFHFEFGLKGEYGAPRDLSGEVPQVYATWINGLTPGRYYVRAWTFRYVQTALDGATFQEYYFDVTPNEWAGDVTLPMDLRLSSWVNKTVYFHDTPNTIETSPIHSGAGYLWGTLTGSDGHVYSANVTGLGLLEQNVTGINPACFSGVGGYLSRCPYLTPGQAVHPTYYSSTVSFVQVPNFNACYLYDQYSKGITSLPRGIFASGFPASTLVGTTIVPLNGEFGAPAHACPFPTGKGSEVNALDKAGLNANSLATGEATIQFWGINDTWGGENYGIPSGTYTPNVATDGYYSPSPPEQVSVTLSGNPTSVSDHLFLGPGFNVSVYSIDWERPRVSRPWVWSGCQTQVVTCLGSEIDLGFYPVVNGTAGRLADQFGPSISAFPPSVPLFCPILCYKLDFLYNPGGAVDGGGLFQGPAGTDCVNPSQGYAYTCAEMDGGGRNVLPGYELSHNVFYGSSALVAFVGGSTSGVGWSPGVRGAWRIGFGFLRVSKLLTDAMWTTPGLTWPHHFSQGQYNLAAYTYGYIQDKDFSAYAMNGQTADMKINLIVGVNITLDILFKKESIITGTPYNMSARVRVFNDQSQLVAEWMSSEGTYVDRSGHAIAANGQLPAGGDAFGVTSSTWDFPSYPFNPQLVVRPGSTLNGYDYLPGGTNLLHVLMAGLPQQTPYPTAISGGYFSDPIFTPGGCTFEIDCPNPPPRTYGQYPFPYTGIAGAPDYTGGWTAEVDFVPWYANSTGIPELASGGLQTADPTSGYYAQYYPPVTGLLMGESYHIIPGTTALSGISLTEDTALAFLKHSMAPNHLGPYSQEGVWQIANAHNSGEASAIFEVDLNGFVSGNVLAFTWSNEFRTLSWGAISVTGAPGGATWNFYTYDGVYQAFMPPGQYSFTIAQPGYAPQTWSVSISPGQTGTGQNVYLEQSNIPVPEFSGAAVVAFSALAASVYLLKRRRK